MGLVMEALKSAPSPVPLLQLLPLPPNRAVLLLLLPPSRPVLLHLVHPSLLRLASRPLPNLPRPKLVPPLLQHLVPPQVPVRVPVPRLAALTLRLWLLLPPMALLVSLVWLPSCSCKERRT